VYVQGFTISYMNVSLLPAGIQKVLPVSSCVVTVDVYT